MKLEGKRVLVIGERDGVNGPAIEACVKSAGAEVLTRRRSASSEPPREPWTLRVKVESGRSSSRRAPTTSSPSSARTLQRRSR